MNARAEWMALALLGAAVIAMVVADHWPAGQDATPPGATLQGATIPIEWRASLDPRMATTAEWALLPKVGPVLARRLDEASAAGADLRDRRQLDQVPGIGPSTLAGLDPWLEPQP